MTDKLTYEELDLRVKELEKEALEQKQAMETLKESEELFRLVFDRSNDVMLVHDFAYADISFDGYKPPSLLAADGAKEVAVELYDLGD